MDNPEEFMREFESLDPNNPRDQDRMNEISAMLAVDGVSTYPDVLELVRLHGSKEAAYEALLKNMPNLENNLYQLRVFMALAVRAEREITASN